jgi:hypothetical protein
LEGSFPLLASYDAREVGANLMWVPAKLAELFSISRDTLESLRKEVEVLKTERDALKLANAVSQNHFDWLRVRVNQLENERAQLIKKAYNIDIPVPEVVRQPAANVLELNSNLFEDLGEENAKTLGLPQYN